MQIVRVESGSGSRKRDIFRSSLRENVEISAAYRVSRTEIGSANIIISLLGKLLFLLQKRLEINRDADAQSETNYIFCELQISRYAKSRAALIDFIVLKTPIEFSCHDLVPILKLNRRINKLHNFHYLPTHRMRLTQSYSAASKAHTIFI